jgi:hypothetical protein
MDHRRLLLATVAIAALAACAAPDCPSKSGYNPCGYCDQDILTSSNPHAGMCTYCTGYCGTDPCNPCGTGTGTCDASWVSLCGTTANGIQFQGEAWRQACGSCPSGTHNAGVDTVTAGGPYYICMCNGF